MLTHQMKRHTVIINIMAVHGNLDIACFLKVTLSLVIKVCKNLEATDGNSTEVAECKASVQCLNNIRKTKTCMKDAENY